MDREECISKAQNAAEADGVKRTSGRYWRNLAANELSARYPKKRDLGQRIKCGKWRTDDDGLSVNCSICACAVCSILLSKDDRYVHAVALNLIELAQAIEMDLAAFARPLREAVDGIENPCHFVIAASERTPEDLSEALTRLADWCFPKMDPRTDAELSEVKTAQMKHAAIFTLVANTLSDSHAPTDGPLDA